jgi:hypothetical protein
LELVIPAGDSASVEENQPAVQENILTPDTGPEMRSKVILLPVEILQPELDENLEPVKDSDGKDKLVDPGELRFCRWIDAFPKDSWKYGGHAFDSDFIEKDRDRVVVRTPGAAFDETKQTISGFVRTEDESGSILDPETEVEFTRNNDDEFEFTLAMMALQFDDQYDPATLHTVSDERKNDPTHFAKMRGKLVIRFPDLDDVEIEKGIMKPKATVEPNIFVLAEPPATQINNFYEIVQKDFPEAEEIFAQIGIELKITTNYKVLSTEDANALYDGDKIRFDHNNQDLNDILRITGSPRIPSKPTIFFVNESLENLGGNVGIRGRALAGDNLLAHGYAAVSAVDRIPNTFAHELGHLLGLGLALGPGVGTRQWMGEYYEPLSSVCEALFDGRSP